MITFDFHSTVDSLINQTEKRINIERKNEIYEKFSHSEMTGWTKEIDPLVVNKIIEVSKSIKEHSKCLVVIGIGGSFLGSYAVKEALTPYFNDSSFPIIYAGTTLSSKYMSELLAYLENIDFSINVISKSGTTMETTITYKLIKDLMIKKYSKEELKKRIIITTDALKGDLRAEALEEGYCSFVIPDDIGGRYSIMTPAHLLPLAFNIDINKFIKGYNEGKKYQDDAYLYACIRKSFYQASKYVENFCVYEEKLIYFTEWLKQLFGESEGKENKGIFPVSTVHTRDLHSLGQFIQDGHKIIFETFIKIDSSDNVYYQDKDLHTINNVVLDSVKKAHYSGDVGCCLITIPKIDEENLGELMYFFMMSAAFSGFLFGINPFDQPGVEIYKMEVRENLEI